MIKEIISYNGTYPCLCHGELTVMLDSGEITKIVHPCASGGHICASDDYSDMWAEYGPWEESYGLDGYSEEDKKLVVDWFNENVEHGCCGGCI